MATTNVGSHPARQLPALLRRWRELRARSQLDVALEAGISQRHFSFIENGRAVPSRETLLAVAEALRVPLRERNELLLASGYAPLYTDAGWNAAEMRSVTNAVERMLRQHEPYPSVLMDRSWNVLTANAATQQFFNAFIDVHAFQQRTGRRNLLTLMFDPLGMRPYVHDWATVSPMLLQRVRREAVGQVIDDDLQSLLDELAGYADVPAQHPSATAAEATALPIIPIGFVHDGILLRYFSLVTIVGAPRSVAAQELRVESLFPADERTEAAHLALIVRGDGGPR